MDRGKITVAVILVGAMALAGCMDQTTDDGDLTRAEAHQKIMAKAREVAEDLDTPEEARAAGYEPTPFCVPGMGVHWINHDLLDTELDEDEPEVLLFDPKGSNLSDTSDDEFLAIEYVVVTEGMETNSSDAVPELHGVPFYGPMAGHAPGEPWHAELHVYVADGLESSQDFPQDQPDKITCPRGTTPPEVQGHPQIMAAARSAAEGLQTPEAARDAGYEPDEYCIPGMGVHWTHKPGQNDSYFDTEFEPERPEVLLFEPDDGNLSNTTGDRFVAIEWVVVTEGTEMNSSEAVPTFHGVRFYGPMPGHTPEMPWHAELHVYLADGLESGPAFPQDQPGKITCPEGTTPPGGPG